MFILEGQKLNERLTFTANEILRKQACEAWLYSGGMDKEIQQQFLEIMQQNWNGINQSREEILCRRGLHLSAA